ncbi:MAG: hypothetical protein ACLU0O_09065 [Collinsella sp.]
MIRMQRRGTALTEDEAGHEESECEADDRPESDTSEETILLDSLPAEDSLTRELPGLGSAPAVDETIAMGDIPLPSVPSAHEAEARHRKMSPKRRNLMVAGVVAVALVAGGTGYAAWNGYRQEQAAITAANAHTMMSVQIGVHAAGLDCSAGSKIPVQVSGQDSDGSSVSETSMLTNTVAALSCCPAITRSPLLDPHRGRRHHLHCPDHQGAGHG